MRGFSKIKTWRGVLAVALVTALFCARSRAAEQPVVVGVGAVRSVESVEALAKDLGVQLGPRLSAAGLEQQFPFIGAGGLAPDRPIGLIWFGAADLAPEKGLVFVLPVKPSGATIESLKASGGQPMADHPDTVLMNGAPFRRTAEYLIFGADPAAVTAVTETTIADALKSPDALARMAVDLKAIRQAMPEQFKGMVEGLKKNATANVAPAQQEGAEMAAAGMQATLEKLDRVELGVDRSAVGLRLLLTAQPLKIPAAEAANLPAMPAGVIARLDLAGPAMQALQPTDDQMKSLLDKAASSGAQMSPQEKQQVEAIVTRVKGMLLGDRAMSVGVEMLGDAPAVYVVNRFSKPIDYTLELRKLVGQCNALAAAHKEPAVMELQTYPSGDVQVIRLRLMDHATPKVFIDAVQKDDTVLMAASPKEFRCIDRLLAAKGESPMPELASGSVDLGLLWDVIAGQPGSPLAGMPAEKRKEWSDGLRSQKLTMAVSAEADVATFSILVPPSVLPMFDKVGELMRGGGGGGTDVKQP